MNPRGKKHYFSFRIIFEDNLKSQRGRLNYYGYVVLQSIFFPKHYIAFCDELFNFDFPSFPVGE